MVSEASTRGNGKVLQHAFWKRTWGNEAARADAAPHLLRSTGQRTRP